MAVRIIFETHSITEDNERGSASGWLPGRLSEQGRRLAYELGRRRSGDDIDGVFTSDLNRAVETAEIAFGDSGIQIRHDPRLRECNYGRLNGMPVYQLERERSRRIHTPYPYGESYAQVVDRVRDFLADLEKDCQGKQVLVIGHSATRWSLDRLLKGIPLEDLVDAPFDWQPGWEYVLR